MDCIGYRLSGELSDITVVVDNQEFHLHKFPLFVRSNYFKNLSSLQSDSSRPKSRVVLENFPGGASTFEIIADYCYNKEVDINMNNVVSVKCAAEYLEMTGGTGRSGLVMLSDNILFDLTYSAKAKRDFYLPLVLLDKAAKYKDLADKSALANKLIESAVENLNNFLQSTAVYDRIENNSKNRKPTRISLSDDSLKILNNLPLDWMNEFVKLAARVGLNRATLSVIIENYIDYNTGLNPHYHARSEKNPSNLMAIAASVIKVDKKLSNISKDDLEEEEDHDEHNSEELSDNNNASNLMTIAASVLKVDKELSKINQDKSDTEDRPNAQFNLINIAADILAPKTNNLNAIAADIINSEKPSNLITMASEVMEKEPAPSFHLAQIAGDILEKEEKSENLKSIAGEIFENEQPNNLISIAGQILQPQDANLKSIAAEIIKPNVSNQNKLKIIEILSSTLIDLRLEPEFSISWLLIYMNVLHELKADHSIRSAFNSWTWNAINDLKSDSKELSSVPSSAMIDLARDVSSRESSNTDKLIDLVDKYANDMIHENKMDIDTFIRLVSAIPKHKRSSFDRIANLVLDLLNKESHNIDSEKQQKLLDLIDFDKLNETTLTKCDDCELIPQKYVTKAALNLCSKLRKQLDDAKLLSKSYDTKNYDYNKGTKIKIDIEPSYSSTSKYSQPKYGTSSTAKKDDFLFDCEQKYSSTKPSKTTYSSFLNTPLSTSTSKKYTYPKYGSSSSSLNKTPSKDNYSSSYKSKYSKSIYQTYRHYNHYHDCLDNGFDDAYDYVDYFDDSDSINNYSSYYGYSKIF